MAIYTWKVKKNCLDFSICWPIFAFRLKKKFKNNIFPFPQFEISWCLFLILKRVGITLPAIINHCSNEMVRKYCTHSFAVIPPLSISSISFFLAEIFIKFHKNWRIIYFWNGSQNWNERYEMLIVFLRYF